jgi:hypothetical protein
MAPSAVNNAGRADEGMIARWYKDISGSLASAGSANAYTLAINRTDFASSSTYDGYMLAFQANFGNTGAATLNVTPSGGAAVGALTIKKANDQDLASGDIESGQVVVVCYDHSTTTFQMISMPATLGAASETSSGVVELATDAETATGTDTARAVTPANIKSAYVKQGTHTIWVPAAAMYAATTNGAGSASVDSGSEDVEYKVLDFDTSTQEFAHFSVRFPKSWNEGTVTFAPYWTAASGSGGVVFAMQGVSLSNDDAINTAYGTEQTSTDTLITAADVHVGPTSSAITIAGTPAAEDLTFFRIKRNVSDGSDTLGVDARLLGVALFFTINSSDDA